MRVMSYRGMRREAPSETIAGFVCATRGPSRWGGWMRDEQTKALWRSLIIHTPWRMGAPFTPRQGPPFCC